MKNLLVGAVVSAILACPVAYAEGLMEEVESVAAVTPEKAHHYHKHAGKAAHHKKEHKKHHKHHKHEASSKKHHSAHKTTGSKKTVFENIIDEETELNNR